MESGGYPENTKRALKSAVFREAPCPTPMFTTPEPRSKTAISSPPAGGFSVTALGKIRSGDRKAYIGVLKISFAGAHFRTDIGRK